MQDKENNNQEELGINKSNDEKSEISSEKNLSSNETNIRPHNDNEKTKLMDVPPKPRTARLADPVETGGDKAKKAAKFTLKSSGFILRKVLTYALNIFLTVLLVGVITGAVVGIAFIIYVKNYIDPEYNGLDNLKFDSKLSTSLYYTDREGKLVELENDRLYGTENRLWAEYGTIPNDLVNAYVSIEDQRFFSHNGVDTKRTFSAIYNFFIPTKASYGGGSTITQQLIKNVTGENETTIQRKVQEIFRALNVEEKFSKREILEMYLNTIYLSQNTNGVRAAADTYFGKELKDLTLVECASLAALAKSPLAYDPILNPKNNLQRRNLVLKQMLAQEKITEEQFNEAYDAPLVLKRNSEEDSTSKIHSYYIDAVLDDAIQSLMDKYGYDKSTASRMLYSGGLQITTCLDPTVQSIMEKVFTDESKWPKVSGIKAQGAMCITDPKTGNLLGIVGGRGEKKISRGLNRATQSKRQCGSSIKPLSVYSLAINEGLLYYGSSVDDVPVVYYADKNTYWPQNSNKVYLGRVSLSYAVKRSLNTIAVDTCQKLGLDKVYDNLVDNLGFTTLVESVKLDNGITYSDKALSPLSLGSFTFGVTVREMTQAYTVLANGGTFVKARTFTEIKDNKGNVIISNSDEKKTVYSETSAYITTSLLFNVVKTNGTAAGDVTLEKKFPNLEVAGKTGTTNDRKDNYFCGYTPDFVGCTWYGYDNNKTIVAKGNPATQLWNYVMNDLYTYLKDNNISYREKFNTPAQIVKGVTYCTTSGQKPTDACAADPAQGGTINNDGVYKKGTEPRDGCSVHVLVRYDSVTKGISIEGSGCPEENIKYVGLRKLTDREFRKQVTISDAQFVYRDVPAGYTYPTDPNVPFFQNIIPSGVYVGVSNSGQPYNRICPHSIGYNPGDNSDVSDTSDISDNSEGEIPDISDILG